MEPGSDSTLKSSLLLSCRRLLGPIVRMLLRGGVTWAEFAELGKEVYVEVARQDYGIQGRPTNSSRVAMLTGLSRREVGRVKDVIAGDAPREPAPLDRLSNVLTGWHTDSEFLAEDGSPAMLPRAGATGSLDALLRRYAGDMPHGAVLKEMEKLGLILTADDAVRVTARNYVRSAADPDRIRQAGIALHDHAETIAFNVDAERHGPARFERMATASSLPSRDLPAFRDFIEKRGQEFLEEADEWLRRNSVDQPDGNVPATGATQRCGVGVFMIQNDSRGLGREKS